MSEQIVELEGADALREGLERRRAIALAFGIALAVGGALVGRDGPAALVAVQPAATLSLPAEATDATLFAFPDRLANEPLPASSFVPMPVRATVGLTLVPSRPGDPTVVTWTENGILYSLSSPRRPVADLIDLANKLRR